MGNAPSSDSNKKLFYGLSVIHRPRRIYVKNIHRRVSNREKELLKKSFDKYSEDDLLNKHVFRIDVLGAQVPDAIAERIFCSFATCISI